MDIIFGNVLKNDLIENLSSLELEGIKTTKLASSKANKILEEFIDSVGSSMNIDDNLKGKISLIKKYVEKI